MHIEINVGDLNEALGYVVGIIEKRSTLPILGFFLLKAAGDQVEIVSTDLEIEIATQTGASVHEAGTCVIPGRKVFDICRSLPRDGLIRIRTERDKASLTAGRSRFSLLTFAEEDYPRLNVPGTPQKMELEVETLRFLLEKTAFSMAQQDVRFYLNGLFCAYENGSFVAVTTDGHRLSKVEMEVDGGELDAHEVIIPGKAVQELKRILASLAREERVSVAFQTGVVSLEAQNLVFHTKLIDAKYPDYTRVIPQDLSKKAVLDKEMLRAALVRMSTISYDKYKGIEFVFDDGSLRLVSKNAEQEIAEEDLDIDYSGEKTSVAFNSAYVVDVLNAISTEAIEVNFSDGEASSIWRGEDRFDETYVVMPMRL